MPIREKTRYSGSILFDLGTPLAFDNVAAVGAGVANTAVQARLPVPQRFKIVKATANYSAIGSGGAHSIQIVVGNGAEGAVGTADTVAPAGTVVFNGDQNLANATADVPTVLYPALLDVIYDTGQLLTLRAVTPGGTGSFTNLKVTLYVCVLDAHPYAAMNPTPLGNYQFDGSVC